MLRVASALFVIGIALALVGLALDGGTLAVAARMGFYAIVPIALVVGLVGMLRAPRRTVPGSHPSDPLDDHPAPR